MIAYLLGAVFALALLLTRPGVSVPGASRARARWRVRRARRRARARWGRFGDLAAPPEPPNTTDLAFWSIIDGAGDRP